MNYSLQQRVGISGENSPCFCDVSWSREPILVCKVVGLARVPFLVLKVAGLPLEMSERGQPAVTRSSRSILAEFSQLNSALTNGTLNNKVQHFTRPHNVGGSFKFRGNSLPRFRFDKNRISRGFGCPSYRADISGTSSKRYRRSTEVAEESDGSSIWDSNAESIRRGRPKSRPFTWDSPPGERAAKKWDYASDTDNTTENWQWWRTINDEDAYESDTDDEVDMGFSLFNFDVTKTFSALRWMFPAAVVLLPWLSGSPMLLMMAFAFFPVAQKFLGPLLPDIWRALLQSWSSSQSKPKRKKRTASSVQSKARSTSMRPDMEETGFSGLPTWADNGQASAGFSDDLREEVGSAYYGNGSLAGPLTHKQDKQGRTLNMGGWEELEEDRQTVGKLIQGKKKAILNRRPRKKEVPLFFRLLIALFPFLRSWGGFL